MRSWYYKLLCGFLLLVAVVACERRDLVDPSERQLLRVIINTHNISNLTCDIYNPNIAPPKSDIGVMRAIFYDPSGERLLSEGFLTQKETDDRGREVFSGYVTLSPGNYRLLAYNFDTPSTLIRNHERWHTLEAYTSEISEALRTRYDNRNTWEDNIYYEPDHLFVGRDANLTAVPHEGVTTIEMDAHSIVETYYIQIRVKNVEYASTATAVLSGLSCSNLIAENTRNVESSSAIFFEMHKSTDANIQEENKDVICAVFNTFGRIEEFPSDLHVTLNVITRTGEVVEKSIDMGPIFESPEAREHHWLLIDEVWELPEPEDIPSTGGGFVPEVDDWENEEQEIPINM